MPTEKYAKGTEIRHHCERIAKTYDLYRAALFQTVVKDLRWNEDRQRWIVTTSRGDEIAARFVISCTGVPPSSTTRNEVVTDPRSAVDPRCVPPQGMRAVPSGSSHTQVRRSVSPSPAASVMPCGSAISAAKGPTGVCGTRWNEPPTTTRLPVAGSSRRSNSPACSTQSRRTATRASRSS